MGSVRDILDGRPQPSSTRYTTAAGLLDIREPKEKMT